MPLALLGQNLSISSGASVRLSGGTEPTPAYLVLSDPPSSNVFAISGSGNVITEGQYNRLRLRTKQTASASYNIPFSTSNTSNTIPLNFSITTSGTETAAGLGYVEFSSYGTSQNNLPLPIGVQSIAHVNNALPVDGQLVYDRYWFVDAGNYSTKPTATLSLGYTSSEKSGGLSGLTLNAQQHDGTKWLTQLLGTDNSSVSAVQNISLTPSSFNSIFTLVGSSHPLPIILNKFTVDWMDKTCSKAVANWSTASEFNTLSFAIERTSEGRDWEVVGELDAAQNSQSLIYYSLIDEDPLSDYSYYRLREMDVNGHFTYSDPVTLYKPQLRYEVYPNPVFNDLTIDISENLEEIEQIQLFDNVGKVVWSTFINKANLPFSMVIDTREFENGFYTLSMMGSSEVCSAKLIFVD